LIRVLIDTNVIIFREDVKATPEKVSQLLKILQENGYQVLLHPASIDDLNNDKDGERKKIVLSKLDNYLRITDPPKPDQEFYDKLGNPRLTPHTAIDLQLLYAIYKNAAHIFITEDLGIHKFAVRLGIENKYSQLTKLWPALEIKPLKCLSISESRQSQCTISIIRIRSLIHLEKTTAKKRLINGSKKVLKREDSAGPIGLMESSRQSSF
jgi:hypothetical protein